MGKRRKARECALQMLFAAEFNNVNKTTLTRDFWSELFEDDAEAITKEFANSLTKTTLRRLAEIDERIKTHADHWRIERMAIVDRNILRLAVGEFLFQETPHTVVINEALEIARSFSTYEATQFINGILDAVKNALAAGEAPDKAEKPEGEKEILVSKKTNGAS